MGGGGGGGEMNGGGGGEGMEGEGKGMKKGKGMEAAAERTNKKVTLMWGYLPGVSPQRSPILHPVVARMPEANGDNWRDVCGGGCGFAIAISQCGKLLTWGSTDDMGQSYLTSGKHEEIPEPFPLPTEAAVVNAAAGWAHCAAVTDCGEVYTWGWKECVPSGRVIGDQISGGGLQKDEKQVSPRSVVPKSSSGTVPSGDSRGGDESTKRRKLSLAKQGNESSTSGDDSFSTLPCLVALNSGVRITIVAAGGRHTLALSDVGQVWGWGYGGEGQLGLGSRIRTVASPHPVPCVESAAHGHGNGRQPSATKGTTSAEEQAYKVTGCCVKAIACGGRHSAVITDTGALLTFGWGLYGQCGQGSTDDELNPTCVSALLGVKMQGVAAGLWHTVCMSADGDVYVFGGNQFGQLGTGSDQAETLPKLLDAPCLENKNAKIVSCGARHSAMVTEDGEVFCWGWNKYGQLGLGDAIDRSIPSQVSIKEACHPTNVSCGWWHTLMLADSVT